MDFEYRYDGELYSVRLENSGRGYLAVIGEKEISFESSQISPNELSLLTGGSCWPVYVAESDKAVFVHIDGQVFRLEKGSADNNNYAAAGDIFGVKDEVSTPMPGKVVKILVKKGDVVKARQTLLIVESMKMENKVAAPSDGEIESINFSDGDLVEPGQAIIKLKLKE